MLLLLAAASLTIAGAAPSEEAPRRTVLNRVVAIVDDECITTLELDRRWAPSEKAFAEWQNPDGRQREDARRRARRETLDAMIDARLVAHKAADAAISVSAEEVDRALRAIAASRGLEAVALLKEAERQGYDEPTYRALVAEQILEGRLLRVEASNRGLPWASLGEAEQNARLGRLGEELRGELREAAYVYDNLSELEEP